MDTLFFKRVEITVDLTASEIQKRFQGYLYPNIWSATRDLGFGAFVFKGKIQDNLLTINPYIIGSRCPSPTIRGRIEDIGNGKTKLSLIYRPHNASIMIISMGGVFLLSFLNEGDALWKIAALVICAIGAIYFGQKKYFNQTIDMLA